MMLKKLNRAFAEDIDFQTIVAGLRSGMREQMIAGLTGSARQVMLAALVEETKCPLIIVTNNMFSAQKMVEDLNETLSPDQVMLYPANELMITEAAIASPELMAQRIDCLSRLCLGFQGVLVIPYAGLRKFLPHQPTFANSLIHIKRGESLQLESFLEQMTAIGYERVERVESKGEMSVRGGIIDFFPVNANFAYRIELFDIEIDSIRSFDVTDQRSLEKLDEITIPPCREIIADKRRFLSAAQHASELLSEQCSKMVDRSAKDKLQEHITGEIERLREGQYFQEIYKYISLLYPERHTIMDYVPKNSVLVFDEPTRLLEIAKQLDRDEAEWKTNLLQEGKILPAFVLSKGYESLLYRTPFQVVYLSLFLRQIPQTQPQNIVNYVCRPMQNFHGQMNLMKSETERFQKAGSRVLFMAADQERAERMTRILRENDVEDAVVLQGNLQSGFELPAIRLVVITEGEIFHQKQRKVRADKRIENAERIKSYTELKVGDYVVHVNHGIGKFVGIGTLEINGIHKDYVHIVYGEGDKLSVPIEQIDMVQKYIGSDDKEPKITKLGGNEWNKAKNKARASVKDIADDLIKLYAERQAVQGYAFTKDTPYQREFEGMFPYEETPDQLRAIEEIKKDMELPRPMDRLLCGDVGYGKTEVAIRAAFKSVMDNKQVAVLVPTTILAQQHYETFRERFADYPVKIQVLSRFRSAKEQKETIKNLKTGTVDVVIGTHRLLSQDIQFKDLGLLIVDEEQRFGVTHKEKLKRFKSNVDVLTLTATPIPRTLHMSLLGVRDLSVIETPPENRFPVQTYVVEYSPVLVREAIEREMARGGQVYYLFNRVDGIYQTAEQINMMVPDARVAVIHGQMSEAELEKTILDFLDGEFDVLVSTTIIETGVDIPNVNTLIIHDADKMGLSQLYQLRGRVGRSNRVAYAYFTYQRDKVLTEVAEKRLEAIKQFTELGSGFKIAMRDLSIRGAGNLLGAQQHGFIASVGFDLYTRMLMEEIELRKKEMGDVSAVQKTEISTQIDITVDAYLPTDYIYDSMQKIEIYKKVAAIRTLDEEADVREEIRDRFGELPESVDNLLNIARIKVYGYLYAIESITQKGEDIHLKISASQNEYIDGNKLFALSTKFDGKIKLSAGTQLIVTFKCKGLKATERLALMQEFLHKYQEAIKPKGALHNVSK